MTIWANTIVHNEENFIWFAIMSVIDYVDKVVVYDTGSTDKTVNIIKHIQKIKKNKILFKQVGDVSREEFPKIRQAMLDDSKCDWILVLDGDEIWWEDSIKRVIKEINNKGEKVEGIVVPFYVAVGDIYHLQEEKVGQYQLLGKKGHLSLRAINKKIPGLHVDWPYGKESYLDQDNTPIQERKGIVFLNAPYLHTTHLKRSSLKRKYDKFKYELGQKVPDNFKYPEVFSKTYPKIVPSPFALATKVEFARMLIETPIRWLKRQPFILLILLLAIIMRFYNFLNFQYFSGDEEIFHAILRRMVVLGKPTPVIPNAQIGGSIGSFFHLLSAPLFFITNSNLILVPIFGSILGIISTSLMYLVGNLIAGRLMGIFAAILYGGSFMMSLFDRRWWPLTPNPVMLLLAIVGLIQISRKKYGYAILVAIAISFAWQADPTHAVILIGVIISFFLLRLPIWNKAYLPALVYLIFSITPLLIFEIRHPGTIFRPFFLHIFSKLGESSTKMISFNLIQPHLIIENLSRSLFVVPSKFIEEYFCYCQIYPKPPLSPLPELMVILVIIFSIREKAMRVVTYFFVAFLLGISFYNLALKSSVYQHYFVTVFPTFFLMAAFVLDRITKTRFAAISWIFISVFLISNLYTLINSSMKYPLWQKMQIVNKVRPYIKDTSFSVYGYGSKYLTDGGWTTFFIWKDSHPARSYLNGGWDWIYRTHSLYTTNPDQGEGSKIVIFHDKDETLSQTRGAQRLEATLQVGNIKTTIYE